MRFQVSDASELPTGSLGLVTMFDCLHNMGDPMVRPAP